MSNDKCFMNIQNWNTFNIKKTKKTPNAIDADLSKGIYHVPAFDAIRF